MSKLVSPTAPTSPTSPLLERGGVDAKAAGRADGVVSIDETLTLVASFMDTTPALRATPCILKSLLNIWILIEPDAGGIDRYP